jgi:hypothetical protein
MKLLPSELVPIDCELGPLRETLPERLLLEHFLRPRDTFHKLELLLSTIFLVPRMLQFVLPL